MIKARALKKFSSQFDILRGKVEFHQITLKSNKATPKDSDFGYILSDKNLKNFVNDGFFLWAIATKV